MKPSKRKRKRRSFFKRLLIFSLIGCGVLLAGAYPAYLCADYAVNRYFDRWGTKLADLERRGLLSKEFGAGWQEVLTDEIMKKEARRITDAHAQDTGNRVEVVNGIVLKDYPSLSIIDRLREIREYSSSIEITDRNDRRLALIKTDHRRGRLNEYPPNLITALIAAEDKTFWENNPGFQFSSFVRAAARSAIGSIRTMRHQPMRGTSTITQQVAKLFISRLDETGRRRVSRSFDRKLRELRIAAALRKLYSPGDILEVYMNHCVTSDYGMVGYKDIAQGLFGKELGRLDDAQAVYLARMVKWGRNVRKKISAQCRVDMPRMGKALGWDNRKQEAVLARIDSLIFARPKRVDAVYGSLVDLANEFWLLVLRRNGFTPEQLSSMDLIDPNSLIRKKGNLRISLTVDAPLQRELEKLVDDRGYGPDTTIASEVRVATADTVVTLAAKPRDTLRAIRILREPIDFSESSSAVISSLNPGDTVIETTKYKKIERNRYRRTRALYCRKPAVVNGQYFAYGIMDSRSGKLLAYYSKDRLGSRLACLLKNRTPNGSSTAKPILNALNLDCGVFQPYSRWNDSIEVRDDVPWKRTFDVKGGKATGVVFANSALRGKGYPVHNHFNIFEGCRHIFDLLATSNNILGAETLYRLNRRLFEESGEIAADALPLVQFFYRIGAFSRIKDSLNLRFVTGVRVYKELVRLLGADAGPAVSDSQYSVALGTLELSLYEQMHLYNILYQNDLIERPADHPSLVIQSIVLNGDTVAINDTVRRYHPFGDIDNVRPAWLGMHKRLVANAADGLRDFDIPFFPDSATVALSVDGRFHPEAYKLSGPPSNFAKSGTTDDCIIPFNAPPRSAERTNYGLWNAVIRVDMAAFSDDTAHDVRDLTIACSGECNRKYTGERDGKTLHKFLTAGLLKKAGIKAPSGFFTLYEQYLRTTTPPEENCGEQTPPTAPAAAPVIDARGD